jgi:hypothetical protein
LVPDVDTDAALIIAGVVAALTLPILTALRLAGVISTRTDDVLSFSLIIVLVLSITLSRRL